MRSVSWKDVIIMRNSNKLKKFEEELNDTLFITKLSEKELLNLIIAIKTNKDNSENDK